MFHYINSLYKGKPLKAPSALFWLSALLFICLSINTAYAQDIDKSDYKFLKRYTLARDHAKKLAHLPIQLQNGRISTFEVFSNRLLKTITNEQCIEKYNSTQVILGFILYPEIWERVPLISQENNELANLLGTGEKHISYRSLFDGRGRYILNSYVHLALNTPERERTELDNQILKLNEKVLVLSDLRQAKSIPLFPLPQDDEIRWYSPGERFANDVAPEDLREIERIFVSYLSQVTEGIRTGNWEPANASLDSILFYQIKYAAPLSVKPFKLKAENFYVSYDWNKFIAHGYLFTGSILIILYLLRLFVRRIEIPDIRKYFYYIFYFIFAVQTLSIFIQGYIYEGRFWMSHPVLMALFAWIIASVGIAFQRKSSIGLFICIIISGLVASFIDFQPHYMEDYRYLISQESQAVRIYYTMILCSISLLIVSSLASTIALVISGLKRYLYNATDKMKELLQLNYVLTSIGLIFFIVTAIIRIYIAFSLSNTKAWLWRNEFKWILITFMAYTGVYILQRIRKPKFFYVRQCASVVALIVMLLSFYTLYN